MDYTVTSSTIAASIESEFIGPEDREVFMSAILSNSARIIVSQQHPLGEVNPSKADINVTRNLVKAGEILGIEVLDCIIVNSSGDYYNFAVFGLIG